VKEENIFLEVESLARDYAAPSLANRSTRVQLKIRAVAFRLLGVRLTRRALPDLAFQAEVDSRWPLAIRQIAVKRASVPAGCEPEGRGEGWPELADLGLGPLRHAKDRAALRKCRQA
jgi:hypothetical protein